LEAFRQGLRELGYVDGQTIALEVFTERRERIPELVGDLVGLKVDVLAALSTPVALAAKNATQTLPIPIVMGGVNPVGLRLAACLSRPEGNVKGLSFQ
jgi:putative ABC transport system substrate-binding protein